MPQNAFGALLRSVRTKAEKSLNVLARHLEVSNTYLSEVEQGRRTPLTKTNIVKTAAFLGVDPLPLMVAASQWSDEMLLDMSLCSTKGREVGASLVLRWPELTERELEAIEKIVKHKDVRM
jgi:transcriptional regulator with XRE-family HTH domain